MKYTEHKELADRLRHEANQALHESVEAAGRVCELNEEASIRHGEGAREVRGVVASDQGP